MSRAVRSPGALVACALALLSLAWVLVVPPFGNADEADHHVRVQGLAAGALLGEPAAPAATGLTPAARAWVAQTTRRVPVRPGRVAEATGCFAAGAEIPATCGEPLRPSPAREQVTQVGTYQPLPYLLPALAARAGPEAPAPAAALRVERLASLLPALLLLVGAALVAGPRGGLLAGVVLAASPAVLLVAAAPGGSGLEVGGAIALVTGLLARPARGAAALALAGGLALVLARSLGPLWLLLGLAAVAALRGLPRGPRALGAGAVLLTAVAGQQLWERAWGAEPPRVEVVPGGESLRAGLRMLPDVLREAVGTTGYLELRLGWVLVLPWLAGVAVLAAVALRGAGRRERLVLLAAGAGALLLGPYLFAGVVRHTGFGIQGRHLLPVLVLVPLLAGALAARPPAALLPLAAAVHLSAVLVLARRYAVGTDGPLLFPGEGWAPPGGWLPPLALAVAGAALLAIAAAAPAGFTARGSRRPA